MTVANISFMQYQLLPVDVSAEKYSKTMVTGLEMSLEMFQPVIPLDDRLELAGEWERTEAEKSKR